MNERIKELRRQATLVETYTSHDGSVHEGKSVDLEKFAELIVKEMCDMMEQCEDDCYSLEPSERPTEYIEWLYNWRTRFEKHFGVEE
jgi:hypothetical protein